MEQNKKFTTEKEFREATPEELLDFMPEWVKELEEWNNKMKKESEEKAWKWKENIDDVKNSKFDKK